MDANFYSVEVIQRSREIAQLRDQKCKTEQLLAESHLKNQRLVDKTKELDGAVARKSQEVRQLSHRVVELEHRLGEAALQHQQTLQRTSELEAEVARKAQDASGLRRRISELEGQLALQGSESRAPQQAQLEQRDEWARGAAGSSSGLLDLQGPEPREPRQTQPERRDGGARGAGRPSGGLLDLQGLEQHLLSPRTPGAARPERPGEPPRSPALSEEDEVVFVSTQSLPAQVGGSQPAVDPLEAFYIGDEDSSHVLQQMQDKALESLQGVGAASDSAGARGSRGSVGSVPPPTPRGARGVAAGPPPAPGTEFADLMRFFNERNGGHSPMQSPRGLSLSQPGEARATNHAFPPEPNAVAEGAQPQPAW